MIRSFAVAAALLWGPSFAEAESYASINEQFPAPLLSPLGTSFKEQYFNALLSPIRSRGRDGRYIDKALIDELAAEAWSQHRRNVLVEVLGRDRNGDGVVTAAEVEAGLVKRDRLTGGPQSEVESRRRLDAKIETAMAADADSDGRITLAEASVFASGQADFRKAERDDSLEMLLKLDPNADGRLMDEELLDLGKKTFSHFDRNRDNRIDTSEAASAYEVQQSLRRPAAAKRAEEPCAPPIAGPADEVVVLGAYEGSGISTVAMSGLDEPTTTGKLVIEPGKTPLYIYAAIFDSAVLRIEGATERVSKLVVTTRSSDVAVGVTGLPRPKIHFAPPRACTKYFTESSSGDARAAAAIVANALSKSSAKPIGVYTLDSVALPSGRGAVNPGGQSGSLTIRKGGDKIFIRDGKVEVVQKSTDDLSSERKGADRGTISDLKRFHPAGVVEIDLKDVVSRHPPAVYDVLPQQAGLIQLMEQGKVRRLSDGVYLIVSPLSRFPAGLDGAHSVKFMLARGVPMPAGSPGHSCVVLEETGRPAPGAASRCG